MKSLLTFAICSLLFVGLTASRRPNLASQSDKFKSGIAGRITDPNGAVVVGTQITIVSRSTKAIVSRKSNDIGEYIADLKPDTYDVEAESPGFKKAVRKGIPVLSESRSFIDFVLEPKPPVGTLGLGMPRTERDQSESRL